MGRGRPRNGQGEYLKYAVISDLHSIYLDERAFAVFLQVWTECDHDALVINGDLLDLASLSSHAGRVESMNPVKPKQMSLGDELDFAFEKILQPLHKAKPKAEIVVRPGNHERRFIRALEGNASALRQMVELAGERNRMHLPDLLRLDEVNAHMSYGTDGVDVLECRGHKVHVIHGWKLSQTRCRLHYAKYGQGTSGHTHKLGKHEEVTYYGTRGWYESGCLRTIRNVEYMDEGAVPDWQQGFVTVWFDKAYGQPFIKQHEIRDYKLEFHGTVYSA